MATIPDRNSMKSLKDMTLKELWSLFPINLVDHDSRWKAWAEEEIAALTSLLSEFQPIINHIGSTAIPGIKAKPIIDILVEIPSGSSGQRVKQLMEANGYICMSSAEHRQSFNKGYTPTGYDERVFHIHVHLAGDNDEIAFRDYLIAHPQDAKEYEALKGSLLPEFRNNRDGYTAAKTGFINRIINLKHKEL